MCYFHDSNTGQRPLLLGFTTFWFALETGLRVSGFPICPFAHLSPAPLLVLEEPPSFDWSGNPAVLRGDVVMKPDSNPKLYSPGQTRGRRESLRRLHRRPQVALPGTPNEAQTSSSAPPPVK